MYKKGIAGFPYYVGIESLAEVATRRQGLCAEHLGRRIRQVTPVSHAYSRGNVVFGHRPGAGRVLKTAQAVFRCLTACAKASMPVIGSTPASFTFHRPEFATGSPS